MIRLLWFVFNVDARAALFYSYGNGFCRYRFSRRRKAEHGKSGMAGIGMFLVEDEIAEAVEYGYASRPFHLLYHMRMVSDDCLGSSLCQCPCLKALAQVGNGLEFRTPMQYGYCMRLGM